MKKVYILFKITKTNIEMVDWYPVLDTAKMMKKVLMKFKDADTSFIIRKVSIPHGEESNI